MCFCMCFSTDSIKKRDASEGGGNEFYTGGASGGGSGMAVQGPPKAGGDMFDRAAARYLNN